MAKILFRKRSRRERRTAGAHAIPSNLTAGAARGIIPERDFG
ncbi:MAG: hypothetical protein U0836_01975 [Pirellulales bacterium]